MKFTRTLTRLVPKDEKMEQTILNGLENYSGFLSNDRVKDELKDFVGGCFPIEAVAAGDGVKRRVRITIEVENE